VVIGHHNVQSPGPGLLHLLMIGDAAVGGDDQAPTVTCLGYQATVEPVPISLSVGDHPVDLDTGRLQEARQKRHRGHTVRIVVAVDPDSLAGLQGQKDPVHGSVHVSQPLGGMEPL